MTRDDSYTPFSGRRSGPPPPILVQRLWRMQKAQSANVLSCGLYLHPLGIEVRCGFGNEEDLLMSQVGVSAKRARLDRLPQIARDFLCVAFRLDVAAKFTIDREPIGRPALRLEIEVPRVRALRPGAPRATTDFAEAAVLMSSLHLCVPSMDAGSVWLRVRMAGRSPAVAAADGLGVSVRASTRPTLRLYAGIIPSHPFLRVAH
jgi:hypothetical protein